MAGPGRAGRRVAEAANLSVVAAIALPAAHIRREVAARGLTRIEAHFTAYLASRAIV